MVVQTLWGRGQLTVSSRHSVPENMAPTIAKFFAIDHPLPRTSFSTSCPLFLGACRDSPVMFGSSPAVNRPNAPPNANPAVATCVSHELSTVQNATSSKRLTFSNVLTYDARRDGLEGTALHHSVYPQFLSALGPGAGHLEPAEGRDLLAVGQHSCTYVVHHRGHRMQVPPSVIPPSALHGTAAGKRRISR